MLEGNPKFDRFVADMRELVAASGDDEAGLIEKGRHLLASLVATDDWLPDAFAEAHPSHFKQYMLHRDPDGLTILCVVWGPGQSAAPHDHRTWGLIGQLRGAERSRVYAEPEPGQPMRVLSSTVLQPGQTAALSPTLGDIHDVENVGERVSVSIHIYGADLEALASRRRRFDATSGAVAPFEAVYH